MRSSNTLISSAKLGDTALVRNLLKQGASPAEVDEGKWTPLHWAAQEGFLEIVRSLLQGGAPVDAADELGFTPLAVAAGEGNDSIVRELLSAGAHANIKISSCENGSALHLACSWARTQVVVLLVENSDADVNLKDATGKTPLSYAIDAQDKGLVTYLKQHGAVA